jgi:transposase InsO family protein
LSSLCTLLGYTRQAFYGQQQHHLKERYKGELIIQQVQKYRLLQPRLGTRKLMVLLRGFVQEHNIKLGRDALFELLREHQLLVRRRKRTVQTTFSRHWYQKYPNLIKQYEPLAPNLLWASDITYIILEAGFAYLSLITDTYSRKIVGFYLSETLEAIGCINALQMAIAGCSDCSQLMHHSDRGVQYCSLNYVDLLKGHHIKISMTENGDPLENAIAERVNGILKEELFNQKYTDFKTAQQDVAKTIVIYNELRPHSSCNMLTPHQAHSQTGILKKHWKNYYTKKEVTMAEP